MLTRNNGCVAKSGVLLLESVLSTVLLAPLPLLADDVLELVSSLSHCMTVSYTKASTCENAGSRCS